MYSKQNWKNLPDQTTPLSAERLNHLESQYENAVMDVRNEFDPKIGSLEDGISNINGELSDLSGRVESALDARFFPLWNSEAL